MYVIVLKKKITLCLARAFLWLSCSTCLLVKHADANTDTRHARLRSAIVIDVIVHRHTAGPFESHGRKQLSYHRLVGFSILSGQFKITLSEQQLVDCDTVDSACNEGLLDNGFALAEKIHVH